jgi:phosphoglycolate phosphatase
MTHLKCGDRVYQNINAVIFDKDGTLSDSHEYLRQMAIARSLILTEMLANRAPQDFAAQLLQTWGLQANQVQPASLLAVGSRQDNTIVTAGAIAALGYDWIESLDMVEKAFAIATDQLPIKHTITTVFPGVVGLLERLRSAPLKLAILSADVLPNIERFAQHYQLDDYFDFYQGAERGLSKPDPKLFDLTCAGLGVTTAQTIIIGDSSADIELGRRGQAAGSIGVSWGWPIAFNIPNADIMLRSIDEIQVVGA